MKQEVRDRFVLPILIPVGLLVTIGAVAVAFGMMLFYSPMTVAVVVAIVVAAAILGGFGLASSQRAGELSGLRRLVIAGAGILPLIVLFFVATGAIPVEDEAVADREPHHVAGVQGMTATLVATEFDFEPSEFAFEESGELEFAMTNDGAALHTFVIEGYEDELKLEADAGAEDSGSIQLDGGSYTFYCDVPGHRGQGMEGTFEISG